MYLIECLNNERIKECTKIVNTRNCYTLEFSTPLEDVAMIQIPDDNIVELSNQKETYAVPYFDSLADDWTIE